MYDQIMAFEESKGLGRTGRREHSIGSACFSVVRLSPMSVKTSIFEKLEYSRSSIWKLFFLVAEVFKQRRQGKHEPYMSSFRPPRSSMCFEIDVFKERGGGRKQLEILQEKR